MTLKELLNDAKPGLVVFSASWCGPCKVLKPAVHEAETLHKDKLNVLILDVDSSGEDYSSCGVTSVPTCIFFKGGVEIDRLLGANVALFKKKVESFIS
jgi:thioredoxin 1